MNDTDTSRKPRATFATRAGVIAATAGSAVGLGNIWRFPYEAGAHGGGAFLLIYVACVVLIGMPVILAEFAIGRETHKNARGALAQVAPRSPLRHAALFGIVASIMILSFYSVVAGWIMEYLWQAIAAIFTAEETVDWTARFTEFATDTWRPALWTVLFLLLNLAVMRRGIQKGIERVSNILMPFLLLLLLLFCVNSLCMPEASEGLRFLFSPDFSSITPSVVIGAMGQAFFSVSIGLGCMLTYASYFSDRTPLRQSAAVIVGLDTLVAILAGIMIFPAVFSFGMEPAAGPKLVFEVFPAIFHQMGFAGCFWSVALFALLLVASLTSTISMSEISISYFTEEHNMSRTRASWLNFAIVVVLAVLCALSFGPLAHFTLFGMNLFDIFDYVSSNVLLPLGGLMFSILVGWYLPRRFIVNQLAPDSAREGLLSRAFLQAILFCIRYIAPIAIILIFIYGLI